MLKNYSHLLYKIIFLMGLALCFACSDGNVTREATEVIDPEQQGEINQFEEKQLFLRVNEPFKGDLSEIRERRLIRVLVSYSKTNFFIDGWCSAGL